VQALVLLAALGLVILRAVRERARGVAAPQTLVLTMTGPLLALMLTTRVMSIQYIIWLLPLTVLLTGTPRWLGIGAAILTALIFPFLYGGVLQLGLLPLIVLVLRNAVLLVMLGWVSVRLLRTARGETSIITAGRLG
jgi:multidrug efflux pump subunit AcrB